jgi:hypothetical protein
MGKQQSTSTSGEGKQAQQVGFFEKLFSVFMSGSDPEKEKKRLLVQIAKQLKKHKYKFYRPKSEEALPALARFFYFVYRVVGPAKNLLSNAQASGALREIIIEYYLSDNQKMLKAGFTEEAIKERIEKTNVKEAVSLVKSEIVEFFSSFDHLVIKEINGLYNLLLVLLDFLNFDFYFFLKKFASSLTEDNFSGNPQFEQINGEYIADDLKDFLDVAAPLRKDLEWDKVFEILKIYKGMDPLSRDGWNKSLQRVINIRNSNVLLLMIRHLESDPFYNVKPRFPNENIVETYLSKMKTQIELTVQKCVKELRNQQVEKLTTLVFGTPVVSRMKHYSDKGNIPYTKKMLSGFAHISPLNFLKAFLLDYFKKDIRELRDLFIIHGKWATNLMSQQLSESFHQLMQFSDDITKFDESLSDEGERHIKLKTALSKSDRDKSEMKTLRLLIKEANDSAAEIIEESTQNLVTLGKSLKNALQDYQSQPHEILINWKEIETLYGGDLKQAITEVYKKLYYMVQLLQYFNKPKTG